MVLMGTSKEDGHTITSPTTGQLVIMRCLSLSMRGKGRSENDITLYMTYIGSSCSGAGQPTLLNVQISWKFCRTCEPRRLFSDELPHRLFLTWKQHICKLIELVGRKRRVFFPHQMLRKLRLHCCRLLYNFELSGLNLFELILWNISFASKSCTLATLSVRQKFPPCRKCCIPCCLAVDSYINADRSSGNSLTPT